MCLNSAKQIFEGNDEGTNTYVNFKGFLVGNPYTDDSENTIGWMRSLYGHGMLTNDLWNEWSENCITEDEITQDFYCDYLYVENYPECLIDDVDDSLHNVKTSETFFNNRFKSRFRNKLMELHSKRALQSSKLSDTQKSMIQSKLQQNPNYQKAEINPKKKNALKRIAQTAKHNKRRSLLDADDDIDGDVDSDVSDVVLDDDILEPYFTCIEWWQDIWLNSPNVREALHVEGADGTSVYTWSECSDDVFDNWPENEYYDHMEDIYIELVNKYNIKIGILSGDDDSVCATEGTMWWLDLMNDWKKDDTYNHYTWTDDMGQVGGYYTRFNTITNDNQEKIALNFITIRSAGHEVPTYKPQRALKVLEYYLNDFQDIV